MERKIIPIPIQRSMRKSCVLLLLVLFSASMYAQITVSVKNQPLKEILKVIETKSEYRFFYNEDLKGLDKITSLELNNAPINQAMTVLLANTGIAFKVEKKNVIVLVSESKEKSTIQKKITGLVTDDKGEPVIGASIFVKGTTKGTITDVDGKFSLEVRADEVLKVSYIGYLPKEILVKDQTKLSIKLIEDSRALNEVVVVGYGSQKKGHVTGSISTVKSEDISLAPIASTNNALAGRLPGLIVVDNGGKPGSDGASLNIRGFGEPLVFVDGIETGGLNNIDASQIENISVLKDASASIYGSRAGKGVILVTTKRGVDGKPKFSFNASQSSQSMTRYMKPVNSGQEAELTLENWTNQGSPQSSPFNQAAVDKYYAGNDPNYPNTNWFDLLLRNNAPQQEYNMSVRGGSDKIKYYAYLGYVNQESFIKKDGGSYNRYNLQSNVDAKLAKNLNLSLDLASTISNSDFPLRSMDPSPNGLASGLWLDLWMTPPTAFASLPDATKIPKGGSGNALVTSNKDLSGYNKNQTQTLRGSMTLKYDVSAVKGLSAKLFVNYLQKYSFGKQFFKPVQVWDYNATTDTYNNMVYVNGSSANLSQDYNKNRTLNGNISLNYERVFANDHSVKLLALFEESDYSGDNLSAYRTSFISPVVDQMYAGSTVGMTNGGSASEMGRKSWVGRINYAYKNRYLLEGGFRADASAKYDANNRWGYFPSVSAGWLVSEESFMKKLEFLDNLKIRGSYGLSGDDGVASFAYLTGYNINAQYMFGGNVIPGLLSNGLANPLLTWEKMSIADIGLEFSIFKRKLYAEFDVYQRIREGIPGTRTLSLPNTFGAVLPPENLNSQVNRGFEINLGSASKIGKLSYDIKANIAYSRNKWKHFEEQTYTDPDQIRLNQKTGAWTDITFGYKSNGVYTSQAEIDALYYNQDGQSPKNKSLKPGDLKILDLNNDSIVNWKDQVDLGTSTPHITYGLSVNLKYADFDFAMLLQGAAGYKIAISAPKDPYPNVQAQVYYDNRWTPATNDPNAFFPRQAGVTANILTDRNFLDAGYLRVKSASIGYNVPAKFIQHLGLTKLRISASGTNLFTFDKLAKFQLDPEAPGSNFYYPQMSTISFGVNVVF